jgi:hypothetical protein
MDNRRRIRRKRIGRLAIAACSIQSSLRQTEMFEYQVGDTRAPCAIEGETVLKGRRKLHIEGLAKQMARPVQASLDRFLPQSEEGCRFLDAHLFDKSHHEYHTEGVRQLVDCSFHQSANFSLCGNAFGI